MKLHHICMDYKKSQFCKTNFENVVPFQNGGQITDFYFSSFQFWPKFEKPLSQMNFSMKFGLVREQNYSVLKWRPKQFFDIAQ